MALIYQALELVGDDGKGRGLFHYCMSSDEEKWPPSPVGGCAENCPGHSTPEAARLHYKEWQINHASTLKVVRSSQERCKVCDEWTQLRATVGSQFFEEFPLCEQHNTLEQLRVLYYEK